MKMGIGSNVHINGLILKNALDKVNPLYNPLDSVLIDLITDIGFIDSNWEKLDEDQQAIFWEILINSKDQYFYTKFLPKNYMKNLILLNMMKK